MWASSPTKYQYRLPDNPEFITILYNVINDSPTLPFFGGVFCSFCFSKDLDWKG